MDQFNLEHHRIGLIFMEINVIIATSHVNVFLSYNKIFLKQMAHYNQLGKIHRISSILFIDQFDLGHRISLIFMEIDVI